MLCGKEGVNVKNKNPLNSIFSLLKLQQEKDGKQKPSKLAYLALIGLLGLLFLISGDLFKSGNDQADSFVPLSELEKDQSQEASLLKKDKEDNTIMLTEIEQSYEKELKELLEQIQGVSNVEVMINLDATKLKIYEKNTTVTKQDTKENDKNGGERTIEDYSEDKKVVLTRQGDQEVPLLLQTKKPTVRGVLVVAKGADHMQVKQWIVESVSRVLDVPSHRISVMPKK